MNDVSRRARNERGSGELAAGRALRPAAAFGQELAMSAARRAGPHVVVLEVRSLGAGLVAKVAQVPGEQQVGGSVGAGGGVETPALAALGNLHVPREHRVLVDELIGSNCH